ncbi:MAG: hypothetical protein JXQ75_12655 [Phycisphaerae bacterium]|nr:hypothetical protein [Phycisphaerae bacterium]
MDRSEQLERLLSEHQDGTLTADELARVRRALSDDGDAADAARRYARLNDLLAGWRALPEDVDWRTFTRQVADRVIENAADHTTPTPGQTTAALSQIGAVSARREPPPRVQGIDRLLEDWAAPLPEVDWRALKSRISASIREEAARTCRGSTRKRPGWHQAASWVARVGLPLAAAAAIAIVVWWPRTEIPVVPAIGDSDGPIVLVSLDLPEPVGQVSVTFEEVPPDEAPGEQPLVGGVAIGVSRSSAEYAHYEEPMDEALLY